MILFNKILDTGILPDEWLVGTIVPIYKNKGDKDDVNNYRGITLFSCMSKLFTSLINERLSVYCVERDLIHESQAGFRKGYSTIGNLFMLKCIIDLFVWKKKKLFCLFIDYRRLLTWCGEMGYDTNL